MSSRPTAARSHVWAQVTGTLGVAIAPLLLSCGGATQPIATTPAPTDTTARESLRETVFIEKASQSPIITVRVVFEAGSMEDPAGREGLTNMTARLMAEGGAGSLSYKQLTGRLFPMAAELDWQVGRDETVFVGRVHADHLHAFYEIFRDVLVAPKLAAQDFERVKAQTRNDLVLELRGNNDEELGKELLQGMIYEGHPFGHPVVGTEAAIAAITLDDIKAHRERIFCAGRATIGLAGRIPEGFVDRMREDFSRLTSDRCVGRRVLPSPPEQRFPRVWLIDKPEVQAVAISMGLPIEITPAHEDYPALVLAASYFGQHRQFAGVLMQKMRGERGLNYGDYAYSEHFEQEYGSRFPLTNISRRQQYFSLWIRPVGLISPEAGQPLDRANFAMRMAVRELRHLVESGLSDQDFQRIREFANGYYSLYQQTESRRLGYALDDAFYGVDKAYTDRLHEGWASLDAAKVNAVIRRYIDPAKLQIAIVAPGASAFADRIAAGVASPITYPAQPEASVLAEDEEIEIYNIDIPRSDMRILQLSDAFR